MSSVAHDGRADERVGQGANYQIGARMAYLRYVTIDCSDSARLARFWAVALGWAVVYDQSDGALVADVNAGYPQLYLQPVPGTEDREEPRTCGSGGRRSRE